jgi:hypothetical protein
MGKSILAYNSKTNAFLLAVQPHGVEGMNLDQIRDYLSNLGYDNAISFDGSDSATLIRDANIMVQPDFKKDNTMPTGVIFSVEKPAKTIEKKD